MPWTTRQPPYDLEAIFPFLKGTARRTTRLHPRRDAGLSPMISKIGGAFTWPSDEAPPVCSTKLCPAIPVIQLCQVDFPAIDFPYRTDLFQLLWYPQTYEDLGYNPKIEIHWRQSTDLSDSSVLQPVYENYEDTFSIHECRIELEEIIEYPYIDLLTKEQKQEIWRWEEHQDNPMARYQYCLSTCPGTKVGGYPEYAGQDAPAIVKSDHQRLEYLLTLSDDEWDGGSFPRWRPVEQQFPPGRTVIEEIPNGGARQYIQYTPEEREELKTWTSERRSQYRAEQAPLGTYLKYPMNVFLDKSVEPWRGAPG